MASPDTARGSRATAYSIVLHVALGLAAWIAFDRPGTGIVSIRDFDEFARRGDDELFSPGALIPIELEKLDAIAHVEPRELELPHWEPDGDARPAELDADAGTGLDSGPKAADAQVARQRPSLEPSSAPDDDPDQAGMLHGRRELGGLAGGGSEGQGVDPRLLRGSRLLYDASATGGAGEGPGSLRRPKADRDFSFEREGKRWVYRHPDGTFVATLQPDGGVAFSNKLVKVRVGSMPSISREGEEFITLEVEYDSVGIVKLASGRDPHPGAKAQLLAATFDMRMEVAARHRKRQLITELGQLDGQLDELWSGSAGSLARRKELLFLRWDECDELESRADTEDDASALDETRGELARAARRKIVRFITEVAPPGSAQAYTAAELADMNRRRVSARAFAPYG